MSAQRGAQISSVAVVLFVLLRLSIGWHFFSEGTKKLDPDFSAVGFLRGAHGPLASTFQSFAPLSHNWDKKLTHAVKNGTPLSKEQAKAQKEWLASYSKRQKAAQKEKKKIPAEFPPYSCYSDWAVEIDADWTTNLTKLTKLTGVTEEQNEAFAEVYAAHKTRLVDFFEEVEFEIEDYQHELWRLKELQRGQEAKSLPYLGERIAKKQQATSANARQWVSAIKTLDESYQGSLSAVLTNQQQADEKLMAQFNKARVTNHLLPWINWAVMAVTLGVGVCLLLGFFTRFASFVGIMFLLSVIATQPPWVVGSVTTFFFYQVVEIFALLVLISTAAGRWGGLDFFTYKLFGPCCKNKSCSNE